MSALAASKNYLLKDPEKIYHLKTVLVGDCAARTHAKSYFECVPYEAKPIPDCADPFGSVGCPKSGFDRLVAVFCLLKKFKQLDSSNGALALRADGCCMSAVASAALA